MARKVKLKQIVKNILRVSREKIISKKFSALRAKSSSPQTCSPCLARKLKFSFVLVMYLDKKFLGLARKTKFDLKVFPYVTVYVLVRYLNTTTWHNIYIRYSDNKNHAAFMRGIQIINLAQNQCIAFR